MYLPLTPCAVQRGSRQADARRPGCTLLRRGAAAPERGAFPRPCGSSRACSSGTEFPRAPGRLRGGFGHPIGGRSGVSSGRTPRRLVVLTPPPGVGLPRPHPHSRQAHGRWWLPPVVALNMEPRGSSAAKVVPPLLRRQVWAEVGGLVAWASNTQTCAWHCLRVGWLSARIAIPAGSVCTRGLREVEGSIRSEDSLRFSFCPGVTGGVGTTEGQVGGFRESHSKGGGG